MGFDFSYSQETYGNMNDDIGFWADFRTRSVTPVPRNPWGGVVSLQDTAEHRWLLGVGHHQVPDRHHRKCSRIRGVGPDGSYDSWLEPKTGLDKD